MIIILIHVIIIQILVVIIAFARGRGDPHHLRPQEGRPRSNRLIRIVVL